MLKLTAALTFASAIAVAAPALAINPQPLPPREIGFHAMAPQSMLDCASSSMSADGKSIDATAFTATEDGDGGCDFSVKFASKVKFVRVKVLTKEDAKTVFFHLKFATMPIDDAKQELSLER